MTFISKSSFLYPANDWDDVNAFLTMGKGWAHGLVPYRNLFEQKGPILYLFYMLAYFISNSYFGVYVLECLFFITDLILFYHMGRLFLDDTKSLLFAAITGIVITVSPFFGEGGSAEEFMMPAIIFVLYLGLRLPRREWTVSNWYYFAFGITGTLIFWIKYTAIGAHVGFLLALMIILALQGRMAALGKALLAMLGGTAVVTVPLLVYFALVNGVQPLFHVYFYTNIALYANPASTIVGRFSQAITLFLQTADQTPLLFLLFLGAIFLPIFARPDKNRLFPDNNTIFLYMASLFTLAISTFAGGLELPYYLLIMTPFAAVPLLWVFTRMHTAPNQLQIGFALLAVFCVILGLNTNVRRSRLFPNNPSISLSKKQTEPAQTEFARIIHKVPNATLLNYGTLDMGIYQAADVLPTTYYFEKQNIDDDRLPEMMAVQNALINYKKVDFVVTSVPYGTSMKKANPALTNGNYREVAKRHLMIHEDKVTWRLYQVKK
ncbi:hypothetical protein [Schleiferilactobacillus shenzhenensis]|nr:hypothetical protein [Schleiferilactobacillus shenzhenensis]